MRNHSVQLLTAAAFAAAALAPVAASASTASLNGHATIVDNAPFYSVGAEDQIGTFDYALNNPGFIDIPYATFSFGGATAVTNATLTWNFDSLFGGSSPAQIQLFAGSDADGAVTTSDRFMGTLINTATYSGGEPLSIDVTSYVNAALGLGQFFAVRLEATAPPATLSGYHGGLFHGPSVEFTAGTATGGVPEPAAWALMITGFGFTGAAMRRRRAVAA